MRDNLVPIPFSDIVIALQYYAGDEAQAMSLARLLADLEPARASGVTLAFCARFDTPASDAVRYAMLQCGKKFHVTWLQSRRQGVGHPHGCNELWAGTFDILARMWRRGTLAADSVFFIEADGCPLSVDWIDRIRDAHAETLRCGKRITGHLTTAGLPHINGSLVSHLSLWPDRPSIHVTPRFQAWDMFHADALLAEHHESSVIQNVYGSTDWTPGVLSALSRQVAWISNCKDDSIRRWIGGKVKS